MQTCKILQQAIKCQGAISFRLMHQKSVGQATIDKGHVGWNVEVRPVYMDAQVIHLWFYIKRLFNFAE